MILLAELDLPGGAPAGWIGASMLGSVLGWLLFVHLPNKDKQLERILEMNKQHIEAMTDKFQAALNAVIVHCKEELERNRPIHPDVTVHK